MRYTLWSRGRLLGESDLGYVRSMPRHRMGDLITTPLGDRLLPIATGVSRAVVEATRPAMERRRNGEPLAQEASGGGEDADIAEAIVHAESLELELRGPDGRVIPTEWVDVRDTEFLLSLAREGEDFEDPLADPDPEIQAAVEHDLALLDEWAEAREPDGFWRDYDEDGDQPWVEPKSCPRYQIQVRLLDDAAVP